MSSSNKLILYSYWRSSCSWRVRAVLEYKKIPYENRPISLASNEQCSEEFKKINPACMVPALLVPSTLPNGNQEILFESLAIIDYLETTYPQPPIYPEAGIQRTKVISVVEMITSGIQPLQNMATMIIVKKFTDGSKEKALEWNQYWISHKFEQLEKILQSLSGKYTVGDQFTIADICLVAQVYNAIRFNVSLKQFPTIKQLYEQLMANEEAIIKSKPEVQPDAILNPSE